MKPEKTFRAGPVWASVFAKEVDADGGTREMRSVSLQRRYKDAQGEWKSSSSYSLAELPQAIAALNWAMAYVAEKDGNGGE